MFHAEIRYFLDFLRKINIFFIFPRKNAYFDLFEKFSNIICVWNYRPYMVRKLTFEEKRNENAKISSACPKKMPTYLVLVGRREAALHRLRLNLFQFFEKVNRLRLPIPGNDSLNDTRGLEINFPSV